MAEPASSRRQRLPAEQPPDPDIAMQARDHRRPNAIPQTIQWVFFDLDGTLRHNKPPGVATFHNFAQQLGVHSDDSQRRAAERWVHAYWASSPDLLADLKAVGDDREAVMLKFAERHLRLLGAPETRVEQLATELHRRMREEYDPVDHVPEEVRPTLQHLTEEGYGLALVSNRYSGLAETVAELELDAYFEFTLAAGEVGWWKPDPRLLEHAAEQAGVEPSRSVYVGDNYYADVIGARSAGAHPVLLDPQNLFEAVDCPVVRNLAELPGLLGDGHTA